jgi:4-amino-4-deoxy-L-arabinose transferase-like glycosyltransferase
VRAVSATAAAAAAAARPAVIAERRRLPPWWPLVALILLAAVLRLATLTEQSFWYDEAFTPVHVLHAGLGATLKAIVHSENTPPLWYLLAWLDVRLFGDGALALRLPSALAGIATVPVVWAIGKELSGRRAALIGAAIVAVNPLFLWYSQEARAYALFVFFAALAMLCFVRLLAAPSGRRAAWFALSGALALLTHYFAVFLLIPMVLVLLRQRAARRAGLPAAGALLLVGLALLPLISAQGGHGTQWIGRWALSSRLQAIPQYFLTGYSGSPLGHGVELLVALPVLAGAAFGAWRLFGHATDRADAANAAAVRLPAPSEISNAPERLAPDPRRGAVIAFAIAAFGVLAPIVLAIFGADYLAPRNLVAAMVPVSVLLAILLAAIDGGGDDGHDGDRAWRTGRAAPRAAPSQARARALPIGATLTALVLVAFLAISLDVDASPRLQRGNWRDLAKLLDRGERPRVLTTVELGAAPLEYYLSQLHLHNLARHASVMVSEIDETGYSPLRGSAGKAPAAGFHLLEHREIDGLIVYRFVSSVPRTVSEADLRRNVITLAHPEVLVPAGAGGSQTVGKTGPLRPQTSSSDQNI